MTIEFQCDGCRKILRTADYKARQTARCPQCGRTVTVPDASAQPVSGEFASFESASEADPYDFGQVGGDRSRFRSGGDEITCPMCGEVNDRRTDRCLACGEPLDRPDSAGAGGTISTAFGDVWNAAWDRWTANLGINLAAIMIAFAIIMTVYMVVVGMMCAGMGLGFGIIGAVGGGGGGGGGGPAIAAIAIMVIGVCVYVVFLGMMFLLQVGLSRFAIDNVRARHPSLGAMFDFSGRVIPSLVVMLVYMIAGLIITAPGTALAFAGSVPWQMQPQPADANDELLYYAGTGLQTLLGVVVTALLWPVPYMLADRRHGLYASMIDGPRMALANGSLSILMALVHLGLVLAGVAACIVGLMFSYSLSFVLFAAAYDRCRLSMRQTAGESS